MLHLSRAVTLGALARDESRGAHYKPDFPKRDDERFLKSTIAQWTPDGPVLTYEAVDTTLIVPRLRNYAAEKNESGTEEPAAASEVQKVTITTGFNGANGNGTNGNGASHLTSTPVGNDTEPVKTASPEIV